MGAGQSIAPSPPLLVLVLVVLLATAREEEGEGEEDEGGREGGTERGEGADGSSTTNGNGDGGFLTPPPLPPSLPSTPLLLSLTLALPPLQTFWTAPAATHCWAQKDA